MDKVAVVANLSPEDFLNSEVAQGYLAACLRYGPRWPDRKRTQSLASSNVSVTFWQCLSEQRFHQHRRYQPYGANWYIMGD